MKRFVFFLTSMVVASVSLAFETILVNQSFLNTNVTEYSDYLNTSEDDLSILQVIKPSVARQFSPVHGDALKFNQLSETTWLRFATNNPTGRSIRMFLKIDAPYLQRAELFYDINEDNGYSQVSTGSGIPLTQRPFRLGHYVMPINIATGNQTLYIKLIPVEATNIQIRLLDESTLLKESQRGIQWNTLVTGLLLAGAAIGVFAYSRFRISVALWSALAVFGFALNMSGWNGSITWWFPNIPFIDVGANNLGAFMILMAISRVLPMVRADSYTSWLSDALVWVSRFFAVMVLLAFSPMTDSILPVQIIMIPVALTILSIFWFEQRPSSHSERVAMIGFGILLIYFTSTTLVLIGLISAFSLFLIVLSLLALAASFFMTWAGWLAAKNKGSRVAVEGMSIPDVHWPLLRKINHEIRGPINGVLGMAELLHDTTLSAHQQEYVSTMQTAGFSLLREADQLQNLIRIGLNRLPESEDEFDLYDLIEDTVHPFSRVAYSKQLELVLDIAPEIPTRYRGNAHIIGQILSNLIDNALKFTEHGEVLIQVKPWQNQRIRFSITDTGPGIAKDSKSQLFSFPDPKNETQQLPKDVHLGLPITKYLVGLLGGQLSLSSELRMGTTFWVDLPLTPSRQVEPEQPLTDGLRIEDLRLMVVDDNLTCRKVIEHLALSWGANVLSMSNGQSALANLHNQFHKGEPIDVLVLDQNMPSMNGFELAERIRQDGGLNRNIVIIMMTGADDVAADFQDSETGIEFILSKPVSARALKQTLTVAMKTISANRESNHAKNSLFF